MQRLVAIQDAVLRRLCDDDLTVVQAALTINRLDDCIRPLALVDALENVLQRCLGIILSSEFLQVHIDMFEQSILLPSFFTQWLIQQKWSFKS